MQGKYVEAKANGEWSLAKQEKALNPEHPYVAASLNLRAVLLEEQVKVGGMFSETS